MAEKNGAFSSKDFDRLKSGFDRSNPALSNLSKSQVLGGLATLGSKAVNATPIGQIFSGFNIGRNILEEKAASNVLDTSPIYGAAVLGDQIQGALTNNMAPSAMSMARNQADTNKDGVVSPEEADAFGMSKGLTAYDVGIDMSRPSANLNRAFSARQLSENPPTISNLSPTSPANPANYVNKDYGTPTSPTAGSTLDTVKDNLGISSSATTSEFSATSPANPANFSNKDYGPAGPPKGIGNQPQEPAPAPDDSSSGPTYICTVIFEQGDMKKSVYKYDKLYGTVAHENLFAGYAVWGKPLANLMKRNKIVYKIAKPIALSWANQMAYDKSEAVTGKRSITGKLIKYIGEPLCYAIGFVINRRRKWLKST